MKIGFIGLGNVGGKLAESLLRNKFDLTVRDLDQNLTKNFKDKGAKISNSAKELAEKTDLIITCLPSPKICAEVMESSEGVINGLSENKIWLEMSTTDESEVKRLESTTSESSAEEINELTKKIRLAQENYAYSLSKYESIKTETIKRQERIKNIETEIQNWKNLSFNSEKMSKELQERIGKIKTDLKDKNNAQVNLIFPEDGVSPGQACVFYSKDNYGDKLLGGGWIVS